VHAFTVATVYGGLKAARNFAVCFGDREKADRYNQAAEEIKKGAEKYLWSDKLNRFVRRLVPIDNPFPPEHPDRDQTLPRAGSDLKQSPLAEGSGHYEVDETIDASLYAVFKFHLFEPDDPRVEATMKAVEDKLWIKTRVGGVARYENDYYHRVSDNIKDVPGNPWFICTLWLADYFITRAKTAADLKMALPIFEWTANHALESGVLAEQVNPYTNEPISVSPLTWSHATVVSTTIKYLEKLEQLQVCTTCNQPIFRLRRPGPVEVKSQATFDRHEAGFDQTTGRETASAIGKFIHEDPRSKLQIKATLAIDTRDCIGCEVCVAHCDKGVLKMVDGKALIDLRHLNKCDLDGECVEVCPTDVVTLIVQPGEERQPSILPPAARIDPEAA
jgi:glucoamylase